MYKKVTKIKKVTKKYLEPYTKVEIEDDNDKEVETKIYGDVITMDIPFFAKLVEHIHTKLLTPAELQAFAERVVSVSKTVPCLTTEDYDKLL